MGLVKNRTKGGDHYWVDAYVSPIRKTIIPWNTNRSARPIGMRVSGQKGCMPS